MKSIQVVSDFIYKVDGNSNNNRSLPVNKKSLKSCLLDLQQYITNTVDEYLGNTQYDDATIAEWIFERQPTSESERERYVMVNLCAAKKTLENIISRISSEGGLTFSNIKAYSHLLRNFLHDINNFINYYKRKTDPNFCFLFGIKNSGISSFETFNVAKHLFCNSISNKNWLSYKESNGMVEMVIRQSIEIKTKRILGINKINKTKKKLQDYGFRRLFEFIESQKSNIDFDPINFEIVKKIYGWSCAFIHNGDGSFIWQTDLALQYLNPIFSSGSHIVGGKHLISVFGAFKISNFDAVRTDLNTFVTGHYQIEYLPDESVEAIIVSH